MPAGRLLSMLLLLQTRGRLSAGQLAAELGISVRTAYRDLARLQSAGVPLYAETGQHGGYRLVEGYRTRLTGLSGGEARALFLAGLPAPAADLGLAEEVAAARLKLLAAPPAELREQAERTAAVFHLDAPGWFHEAESQPFLTLLMDAVVAQQVIDVGYRRWRDDPAVGGGAGPAARPDRAGGGAGGGRVRGRAGRRRLGRGDHPHRESPALLPGVAAARRRRGGDRAGGAARGDGGDRRRAGPEVRRRAAAPRLRRTIDSLEGSTVSKVDLKREQRDLYAPPAGRYVEVRVPPMRYLAVEGSGRPGSPAYQRAVEALFTASYAAKFRSKGELHRDYVVMPLEGLWWADDMATFRTREKDRWSWRMLIRQPDWLDEPTLRAAIDQAHAKGRDPDGLLQVVDLDEGRCLQTLHIGSYDDEGPSLAYLHDEHLPALGLRPTGLHHEIYLSDARRVAPDKLRTILRQPVERSR